MKIGIDYLKKIEACEDSIILIEKILKKRNIKKIDIIELWNALNNNAYKLWAICFFDIKYVKHIIDNGIDINIIDQYTGDTLLHYACKFNIDIDKIKFFINNGADINARNNYGCSLLHYAYTFHRDIEKIKLLVDRGAK